MSTMSTIIKINILVEQVLEYLLQSSTMTVSGFAIMKLLASKCRYDGISLNKLKSGIKQKLLKLERDKIIIRISGRGLRGTFCLNNIYAAYTNSKKLYNIKKINENILAGRQMNGTTYQEASEPGPSCYNNMSIAEGNEVQTEYAAIQSNSPIYVSETNEEEDEKAEDWKINARLTIKEEHRYGSESSDESD